MFQGFRLATEEQLETLREYCDFVDIDTDLTRNPVDADAAVDPSTLVTPKLENEQERKHLEFEVLRAQAKPVAQEQAYPDQVDVIEEIHRVREAYEGSVDLMNSVFEDAQKKRNIDTVGIKVLVGELVESVIRNPDALMLFSQIRNKDIYTAQHSMRVCILALTLGRQIGMESSAINALGVGALLHDIGKVILPDDLLKKNDPLTKAERELMKTHIPAGLKILRNYAPDLPTVALDFVGWHHERYDGSGYMSAAKGNEISQFGHIGAITDHFDAVTSERPWRKGAAQHSTLMNMYDQRGKEFHPELVEQFIRSMGVYPIGSVVQLNTGESGVVITRNRVRHLRPCVVIAAKADNSLYRAGRTVDLTGDSSPDGRRYEIVKVLGQDEHNIDSLRYLPVMAA